ncbi:MAG: DUF1572 family protein [Bacteroidia bacterium]|nr:DUF1572 family protein [Bacteroidia bacterium]
MSKTGTEPISSAIRIFKQYESLGSKALDQIEKDGFYWKPEPESNSIFIIIKHLNGNMRSRWTNFLTTDGEKDWRNRDAEFDEENLSKQQILILWNQGWQCLFDTLNSLSNKQLSDIIHIRGEEHSVFEAINRQIAHYSYHIGQIVYLAKAVKSDKWHSLSIPKRNGASEEFNKSMNHPK